MPSTPTSLTPCTSADSRTGTCRESARGIGASPGLQERAWPAERAPPADQLLSPGRCGAAGRPGRELPAGREFGRRGERAPLCRDLGLRGRYLGLGGRYLGLRGRYLGLGGRELAGCRRGLIVPGGEGGAGRLEPLIGVRERAGRLARERAGRLVGGSVTVGRHRSAIPLGERRVLDPDHGEPAERQGREEDD